MDKGAAELVTIGAIVAAIVATYFYTKGLNTPVPEAAPVRPPQQDNPDWMDNPFGNYEPGADGVKTPIVFAPVILDYTPPDAHLFNLHEPPLVAPNAPYATPAGSACAGGCGSLLETMAGFVNAMNSVTAATIAAIRALADRPLPVPVNIMVASKQQQFYLPRDVPVAGYDTDQRYGGHF